MPKVSIIVPVYNVEKYLRECIDSIIAQTLEDIEIICVDDGSKDNSGNILDEYAQKDNRVKVIHKQNGGYGSAINKGLETATGEYVGIVESDDWIAKNMYECLYKKAQETNSDIVKGGFYTAFATQNIYKKSNFVARLSRQKNEFKIKELPELLSYFASIWSAIYKRSWLIEKGIKVVEDIKPYEDMPFAAEVYSQANKISLIPDYLYYYRQDAAGSSTNTVKRTIINYVAQRTKYREILIKNNCFNSEIKEYYWKQAYNGSKFFYNLPNNKFKQEFYEKMRILYKLADTDNCQFIYFSEKEKKDFNAILKQSYKKYLLCIILKKILHNTFSITNAQDKKHKVIKFLGIKFKFSKPINVYNEGKHKIFKFLFIKIKVNRYIALRFKKHKIQSNKIVFSNYFGKSYGCNPKYITEEILKRKLPYEIVWLVNNPEKEREKFPSEIRLEKYYSKQGLEELLTAKMWVDNTRKLFFWENNFKKNKNQYYIQTWHGTLGMKKIEGAIKEEPEWWRKNAKIDSKNINYLLATSETDKKFLRQSFWYDGEILVSGYPRNDILYSSEENKQKIKEKVFEFLGISRESKFVLYCPTFRDDKRTTCFTMDYQKIIKSFEQKLNSKVVLGTRFHPVNIRFANSLIQYNDNLINATAYPDIMELLTAADILITDYSSCIFDFMHLNRPGFIFATDKEQYEQERGFYFPLEDTPFPISQDNDELASNILNFDNTSYINRVREYMKNNGYADDGHASERIVDLIEEIMKKDC